MISNLDKLSKIEQLQKACDAAEAVARGGYIPQEPKGMPYGYQVAGVGAAIGSAQQESLESIERDIATYEEKLKRLRLESRRDALRQEWWALTEKTKAERAYRDVGIPKRY